MTEGQAWALAMAASGGWSVFIGLVAWVLPRLQSIDRRLAVIEAANAPPDVAPHKKSYGGSYGGNYGDPPHNDFP